MTLDLQVGVPLRALNTFGVDVETMMMAQIDAIEDLPELFTAIDEIGLSWLPLGEGSNVLFVEDYDGIVVRANLKGTDWQGDGTGWSSGPWTTACAGWRTWP
jgi:UDP-N-acetylmuramate dehydrogenase